MNCRPYGYESALLETEVSCHNSIINDLEKVTLCPASNAEKPCAFVFDTIEKLRFMFIQLNVYSDDNKKSDPGHMVFKVDQSSFSLNGFAHLGVTLGRCPQSAPPMPQHRFQVLRLRKVKPHRSRPVSLLRAKSPPRQ